MNKQPVGQLPDLTQSNNDDEIMVITNSEYNQLKKEKISDLITDFTSTNENNALTKGTDGKMFVTDFGNASNITEGTLPTSVLPEIPLEKLPVSGVSADTYAYPSSVTVNAQGQVTAIEEGTPSGSNANVDLSNITDAGKEVIKENSGGGLEVGTIISHFASANFVPENCLPCDGSEYTQSQFNDLYTDWLVGGRLNTCTYEEYQTEIDTYGKCAKFGLDSASGKFKVPTIPNGTHIQQAMSDNELGKSYNAGLPNIKGKISGNNFETLIPDNFNVEGALYVEKGDNLIIASVGSSDNDQTSAICMNASLSSSIYNDDVETVQTEAVALRYFVVVATGAINESEMNWSEWATGLQGKANVDLSNCTKPYITETYSSGFSWYIVYSNGWCEQGGYYTSSSTGWENINLLKTYRDNKYQANATLTGKDTSTKIVKVGNEYVNTASTLGIFLDASGYGARWETKGYLA